MAIGAMHSTAPQDGAQEPADRDSVMQSKRFDFSHVAKHVQKR